MDIGIDLGTTFSVIAVRGQVKLADGYPEGMYLPECDVTIIPTPLGESTIPSVFWSAAENPSEVLVGMEAKQKAGEGEAPIMFSKRSIGTNEALKMHDRTYTAKEVATHILRYLKDCAERALGQPVRRAVITHPAYFERNQVEETREAALAAGFDMALPEQMMMEPAAAALAYIQGEPRDPLLVLTYDLGGGTFDVTVLERREGVISMKAFDGDHLLGGYNFDRALVQWLLDRLKTAGRDIPYDENNPEDRARRSRLLQLAEEVKIDLSRQRTAKTPVQVKAPDILVDRDGKKVQILERITREEYAAQIKEYLDQTIDCCHKVLAKARCEVPELHAILLVGGSSYGPWVKDTVAQAFGTADVQLYNPDLCVGAGAAIQAALLPPVASGAGLEMVLEVPAVSALSNINVPGRIRKAGGEALDESARAELRVLLTTPQAGTLGPHELGQESSFLFIDVALLEGEPSAFMLQVTDAAGRPRLSKGFTVVCQPDAAQATEISTALPKPLFVRTAGGMKLLAEEGKQLPAKVEEQFKRLQSDATLEVEVWREDERIGTIRVERIPEDAGAGAPVQLEVEITQQNEMKGKARVLNRGGAVVAECPVRITFPPLKVPGLPDLRADFDRLEDKRQELIELSQDGEQRLLLGGQGAKLSKKIRKLFDELEPDKQEIYRATRELDRMVNPPKEDMEPPRSLFRRRLAACQDLIQAKGADPQLDPLKTALSRIEADGNDAYATKNHKKWATANQNLASLHDRLEKVGGAVNGGGGEQELPPASILKDHFKQEVDALRSALTQKRDELRSLPAYPTRLKGRCDDVEKAIDKMEADIDKIADDMDSKRALSQIQVVMRPAAQLKKRIPVLEIDI